MPLVLRFRQFVPAATAAKGEASSAGTKRRIQHARGSGHPLLEALSVRRLPMAHIPVESLPKHRDTSLLPDEDQNIERAILDTIGEEFVKEWLYTKNVWLGCRTPQELLGTSDEFHVRALLRSIVYGLS